MANKTLNTRIVIRNDTAANWTTNNTKVLLKGEIGLETDTGKYKIGDGSTTWGNLTYYKHIADGTVFGLVDDVKVDGTSVVSSKIASLSTINGDYNASTNKLATEADIPTDAGDVGALPDTTKYGAGLSVSGTTVQLLDQDGNNLGSAITTQDTGATSVSNYVDVNVNVYKYYTDFTTTDDYVGFIVNDGMSFVEVTQQNKNSLNIVPGTTIAFLKSNGGSELSYSASERKITNTRKKAFVEVNDVDNALSTTSRNPVQNKVIAELIPAQASSSNQLADKAFVNSSISTATATFRGTYNVVSDLSLTYDATEQQIATALASTVSTADNNDYCFVKIPTATATPTEIARIDRYKYNGTAWSFEYSLNNSGYTSAQWAAINSGLSSADKTKLDGIEAGAEVNDVNSVNGQTGTVVLDADDISDTNTTNKFVTASEKSTWSGKQDAIDSSHKLSADLVDDTNTTNKFVTDTDKTTWNGKQDALTAGAGITINNNTINAKGIFYCEYGSTTFNEIADALNAGLLPVCITDPDTNNEYGCYVFSQKSGDSYQSKYEFTKVYGNGVDTIMVDIRLSNWTSNSITLLKDSDTFILDGGDSNS